MSSTEKRLQFVLKRAFRFGSVRRRDIMEAFQDSIKSESLGSDILNSALEKYDEYLIREGNKLIPRRFDKIPDFIDDEELLHQIELGSRFQDTGLRSDELPINKVNCTNSLPLQKHSLTLICQSISKGRVIDIYYVSLKEKDRGSTRAVFPLGLEKKSDQWRLVAHDLSNKNYTIKTFLLSRITSVDKSDKKRPKRLGVISGTEAPTKFKCQLNRNFTKEQREVVKNQLKITNKNTVMLAKRYLYEFKIDYLNTPSSNSITWPLIEDIKE